MSILLHFLDKNIFELRKRKKVSEAAIFLDTYSGSVSAENKMLQWATATEVLLPHLFWHNILGQQTTPNLRPIY